jgi:hypothetical protein
MRGQDMIVQGYQALGKAAGDVYLNTAIDAVLKHLVININLTAIHIDEEIALLLKLNVKITNLNTLKKLYKRAKKSVDFVHGFFNDPGGTACKVLWLAELAAQFAL